MSKLGIDTEKYSNPDDTNQKYSFVLINPSFDFILQAGDIVYLLKPGNITTSESSDSIKKNLKSSINSLNQDKDTAPQHPRFNYTKHSSLDFIAQKFNLTNIKNNIIPTSLSASLKSYLNKKQAEEEMLKFDTENRKETNLHVTISDEVNLKKPNNIAFI